MFDQPDLSVFRTQGRPPIRAGDLLPVRGQNHRLSGVGALEHKAGVRRSGPEGDTHPAAGQESSSLKRSGASQSTLRALANPFHGGTLCEWPVSLQGGGREASVPPARQTRHLLVVPGTPVAAGAPAGFGKYLFRVAITVSVMSRP